MRKRMSLLLIGLFLCTLFVPTLAAATPEQPRSNTRRQTRVLQRRDNASVHSKVATMSRAIGEAVRSATNSGAARAEYDTWTDGELTWWYIVNEDNITCTIVGLRSEAATVSVPDTIESYKVTALGDGSSGVFTAYSPTSVIVPNTVTALNDYAFSKTENMTEVTLPESLETIGAGAFFNCSNLKSINVPDSVNTIGTRAFAYCNALESITFPNTLAVIGESVCEGCRMLKTARMPNSVTEIKERAFYWCKSLESVTLSSGLTTIGDWAFYDCEALTSIEIPNKVKTISESAFEECYALAAIGLPNGLEAIGDSAFDLCTALESIEIPDSVQDIGDFAFSGCEALKYVYIANANSSVGANTFAGSFNKVNIVYSGDSSQWSAKEIQLGAAMAVWCAADGMVLLGQDNFDQSVSLELESDSDDDSNNTLYSGQLFALDLKYPGTIPKNARLAVKIDLDGMALSGARSVEQTYMLTPTDREKTLNCSVTAEPGETATASIAEVGGRNSTTALSINIAQSPSVVISADASGEVQVGQTVNVTVSGENIPNGTSVYGELQLDGLSTSSTSFSLTSTDPTKVISCVVGDAASASVKVASLRAGSAALTPPDTVLTFSITQPIQSRPPVVESPSVAPDDPGNTPDNPDAGDGTGSNPSGVSSATPSVTPGYSPTASPEVYYPATTSVILPPPAVTAATSPAPSSSASASFSAAATSSQAASSSPENTAPPVELKPAASDMPSGVEVIPDPSGTGSSLVGIEIGTLWSTSSADLISSWIENNGEDTVRIVTADGAPVASDEQVATGMIVEVVSPENTVLQEATIVVMGDVTGSGEIDLTQLVRLAQAYSGTRRLQGPYALAGDLDGSGRISLTDLVQLVELYQNGTLYVDCVITDGDQSAVLEDAGYDMQPWASNLAVFSANIPAGADIESIAWTQHDIFPGGREQKLYYEGPEESLVFGTYNEGRSIVTTVVTTASGKTGTREVEVAWGSQTVLEQQPAETKLAAAAMKASRDAAIDESQLSEAAFMARATTGPAPRPSASSTRSASPSPTGRPTRSASPRPSGSSSAGSSSTGSPQPSVAPFASATQSASPRPTVRPSARPTGSTATQSPPSNRPSANPTRSAAPQVSATAAPSSSVAASTATGLLATYRREVLLGANDLRSANNVPTPLTQSTNLAKAAMVRAEEMSISGELSHTRPDGSKFGTVVQLGHGAVIGENIHCNKGYPTPQIAQIAVKGWANSAPHRKQILEKRYAYTGIGFVQADDGMWYCVQMFSNADKVLSVDTPKA